MYHSGHDQKKGATVILEAVADYDLWIWHCNFGEAGSHNDAQVLNGSSLLDDLIANRGPQVSFSVNDHQYHQPYWLVDGIYPGISCFVKQYAEPGSGPQNRPRRAFNRGQSAARKGDSTCCSSFTLIIDVERAFGGQYCPQFGRHFFSAPSALEDIAGWLQTVVAFCYV